MDLATCTYQEFQPSMGVPVRTTVGHPRFKLPYSLAGHAKLIAPTWAMLKLPHDAYTFTYRRHLAAHGAERIAAELTQIHTSARAGHAPLVLLCFDRLDEPDGWCHRTMFADWWLEQTGQGVPELGAFIPAAPQAQQSLFE